MDFRRFLRAFPQSVAIVLLVSGLSAASERISVGIVMTGSAQTGYDPDAVAKCLSQALQKTPAVFGRVLEKVEKTDRFSLQQAGKKAGVDHVVLVDLRPGKDGPLALLQKVNVKTYRSDVVSLPLSGAFGRACDAGFFGIMRFFDEPPSREARTFIDLGNEAQAAGDITLAIGRYSQAMQADVSSPLPPRLIARAYSKAGDAMESMNWYAEALSRRSVDPWSYMEAANVALEIGRRDQAIQYYEYAISAGSHIPMLYKLTGRFYLEDGRYSLAEQNLTKALDLDPQDFDILPLLVDSLAKDERYAEAAKYQEICIRQKPTQEGLQNLAWYYEQAGQYGDAVPVLQKLIAASPENLDYRRRLGGDLENNGRIEEALVVYDQVLTARPDDERIWKAVGRILYRQKNYPEAIKMFQTARSVDPTDTETLRLEGMARELSGDVDGALAVYTEALRCDKELRPSDAARVLALAKKHGRLDAAVENLRSMLPAKNQDGRRVLVMAMGERLKLDGRIEEAIRLFESSIDSMGLYAPPLLALGDLYLARGDYDGAFRTYMRAAAWFGEAAIPLYAAGKFHEAGRLEYAQKFYDYAYGRDAENVSTALALAEIILLRDGDLELVSVYLNKAFTLPKNDMQKEKLDFLMIAWGLRSGNVDYGNTMLRFALQELPKRPDVRLDLSAFKDWIENRFEGADRVRARDIAALFERKMSPADFQAAHP